MTCRVAINGFGRMGRLALRQAFPRDEFELVHVNDAAGSAEAAAHLLTLDTVHGRWQHRAEADGDGAFVVAGRRIGFSRSSELPARRFADLGVDLVLECSGVYRTVASVEPYLEAGVHQVLVSAPFKGDIPEHALDVVVGVNDHLYRPDLHRLVTPASCTTNALAPLVAVLRAAFELRHGVVTTLHSVTNTQRVIDRFHTDLRRARSASNSLIPTSTGSAQAIVKIFPDLRGKLLSVAVRVPLQNASMVDCVFEVDRATNTTEVNELFRRAAGDGYRGIVGVEDRPLVSIDFLGDARSVIVDAPLTQVVDDRCIKLMAWYDNEWGYVARMVELMARMASGSRPAGHGAEEPQPALAGRRTL